MGLFRGRRGIAILAGFMLFTGTLNTIATKLQDTTVVGRDPKTDEPVYFYHPALQSAFMFSGEALCLALHALLSAKATRAAAAAGRPPPRKKATRATIAAFAAPALLDAAGTTLINVGLFYTAASTYQMLRGTLVVFAGIFTVALLRRRLHLHHWLGIVLITAGAALVGASSVIYAPQQQMGGGGGGAGGGVGGGAGGGGVAGERRVGASPFFALPFFSSSSSSSSPSSSSSSNPLLGDLLIVAAQAATALQFITEEKMLERHRVPALLAVGLEGAWGLLLCSVALPALTLFSKGGMRSPLQVIADPARAARVVRRAAAEALAQLAASPRLRLSTAATVLSIAAFNFFGVSVTKRLSGGSRAAADAARTLLVWGVSLALGWESFHALQVLGFVVLLAGSSLYNELIRGCLPPVPSSSSSAAADASSRQRLLRQQQRASSASSGTRHHHHHHHHHHRRPSSAGNAADVEEGGMLLSEPLLPVPPQRGRRRGALAEGEEEEEERGGVEVENLDEVVAAAAAADDASSASSDDEQGKGASSPSRPVSSSSQQQQKRAHFAVNHEQPPPATLSTPPRPTPPSSSAGPSSLLNSSSSSATTAAAAATPGSLAPRPGGIPSSRPLPAAASQHRSHHHHRYTLARSMRLFPPAAMSPHSLASPLPSGARAGESYSYYYGSGEDGNSEDREIDQALWGDYLDTPDPSGRGGNAAAEALMAAPEAAAAAAASAAARTGAEDESGAEGEQQQQQPRLRPPPPQPRQQ